MERLLKNAALKTLFESLQNVPPNKTLSLGGEFPLASKGAQDFDIRMT